MAAKSAKDVAIEIRYKFPDLEFISGKWFKNKIEIKEIDKFFLLSSNNIGNVSKLKDVKECFIILYGTSGRWYDLPIIQEARDYTNKHDMCYPLKEKQLMIINYLLRHDEEIAFILTGVGGSGKSTFANIICQIFDNDTAALNFSDLSNPFTLATGINKRLIYSTEINSDDMDNGVLKQLFSNEEITVNPKNQQPYKTRCQSSFFFNCNVVPRLDLSDTGILRRILYYDMNEKIKNPDKTLNKREWTREDLVNIVRHALDVDMTNWQENFQCETRYYIIKDNSVYILREASEYDTYVERCKRKGLRAFSEPKWQSIRKLLTEWGYIGQKNKGFVPPVKFEPVEIGDSDELPF